MRTRIQVMTLALALVVFGDSVFGQTSSYPDGFVKLNIGDSIPGFDLPGVDDRNHKLADFEEAKVLMIVFTCNHCPTAQAYEERLNKLHDDYRDRSVAIVAISPNDPKALRLDELGYTDLGDTLEDMKIRAKEAGFQFPYLFDGENQKVSLSFGVLATPHVFIFDADRKLRYKGRIDDSEEGNPKSQDARNAIEALLTNQPVPVETTKVFGCSTKWSSKRDSYEQFLKKWDKEPVSLSRIDVEGVKSIAANGTDNLRLVNVWATWCAPCVVELPQFVTINRMYRGRKFEMVTISADDAEDFEAARTLLDAKNVSCRNVLFTSENQDDLFDALDPEWEGALPYTVLIAPGGKVLFRKQGQIDPLELKRAIADCVGRTFASDKLTITEKVQQATTVSQVPDNFKPENLVPWCMVAFDSKMRTPEERAQMIAELGMQRSAYAWRKRHIPEFEQEIKAYKNRGIEFFAFFNWHDSMDSLIKKHKIQPQIWHYMEKNPKGTRQEKIEAIANELLPIVEKTRSLGLKFALYNHRGWTGEPANMVAVIEHIRKTHGNANHVGIVYNFHHGHGDIDDFEARFKLMLPYLLCVNLNGMVEPDFVDEKTMKNKILTIGTGTHEAAMIEAVIKSGYSGPIGIINHRSELDAETALRENMNGLAKLLGD